MPASRPQRPVGAPEVPEFDRVGAAAGHHHFSVARNRQPGHAAADFDLDGVPAGQNLADKLKHGITLPNAPGTIDADYRGELKIILQNGGVDAVTSKRGERIAQLVFARDESPSLVEGEALGETARGGGGFGSTGR